MKQENVYRLHRYWDKHNLKFFPCRLSTSGNYGPYFFCRYGILGLLSPNFPNILFDLKRLWIANKVRILDYYLSKLHLSSQWITQSSPFHKSSPSMLDAIITWPGNTVTIVVTVLQLSLTVAVVHFANWQLSSKQVFEIFSFSLLSKRYFVKLVFCLPTFLLFKCTSIL